eukprot:226080-Prymnesium_polylepis.3
MTATPPNSRSPFARLPAVQARRRAEVLVARLVKRVVANSTAPTDTQAARKYVGNCGIHGHRSCSKKPISASDTKKVIFSAKDSCAVFECTDVADSAGSSIMTLTAVQRAAMVFPGEREPGGGRAAPRAAPKFAQGTTTNLAAQAQQLRGT